MEKYIITQRKLGSGAYGQVYMAFKKETGQQFACKMVDVRGLRKRVVDELDQKSSFFTRDRGSNGDSDLVAVRERRIKEKLDAYNREATVLELLCHVSHHLPAWQLVG